VGEEESADGCLAPGIRSCAEGFVADAAGSCAPVLPEACPEGTMAVPGEATCREVAPCGDGTWGDIPVDGATRHVDAAYGGGGSDGSPARPFTRIADAVAAASAGAVIAIAAGVYAEDIVVAGKPVVLWGRCPAMVEIAGSASGTAAVFVQAGADGSALRALAVTGARYGVAASGAQGVELDRVWVHDTLARGVIVEDVLGPAAMSVRGSLVERAADIGVAAYGAHLTISASAVRDTLPGSGLGRGVTARHGSTLVLETSVIENNHDAGVRLSGSTGTFDRIVIRGTLPGPDGYGGGLAIAPDSDTLAPADATVRDAQIARNHHWGVLVESSRATLERVAVVDTAPQPPALDFGAGVAVQVAEGLALPADVRVAECMIARNHYAGVAAAGATLAIHATMVREQWPEPSSGEYGRGILLFADPTGVATTTTVTASAIERNHEAGLFAEGGTLTVANVAIRATRPLPSGVRGRGLNLQSHSLVDPVVLDVDGLLVEDCSDAGMFLDGTVGRVADVVVSRIAPQADGRYGDAIQLVSSPGLPRTDLMLEAARVTDSGRVGLVSFGSLARVRDSLFQCNSIDLHGEAYGDADFVIDDLGGNRCGCASESAACRLVDADVEAPAPLSP
jgi:hypothetical protein